MDAIEAKECLKETREDVISGEYGHWDESDIKELCEMIEPDGKLNAFYVLYAYSDGCFELNVKRVEKHIRVEGLELFSSYNTDNLCNYYPLLELLSSFDEKSCDYCAISESVADLVNYVEADEKLTVPGVDFLGEPVTGLFFFNAWRNDILNLDLREKNNYKVKVDKRLKEQIPDVDEKIKEFFRVLRKYNGVDEEFSVLID